MVKITSQVRRANINLMWVQTHSICYCCPSDLLTKLRNASAEKGQEISTSDNGLQNNKRRILLWHRSVSVMLFGHCMILLSARRTDEL